jgi:hypothetical protein
MRWMPLLLLFLTTPALAVAEIDETLPEFTGGYFSDAADYPLPPVIVGTFTTIPTGESVVSGSIAGTFGNSTVGTSAPVDLFLGDGGSTDNDLLVAHCDSSMPCFISGAPWSLTFSEANIETLSNFSGPLVLTSVQNAGLRVVLGETTLIGSTASAVAVPSMAPIGIAVFGSLVALAGWRRLRS